MNLRTLTLVFYIVSAAVLFFSFDQKFDLKASIARGKEVYTIAMYYLSSRTRRRH